jgi:hypothetical protein
MEGQRTAERIENDYEDTITRHEYEHEHAYEYDARRHDYYRTVTRVGSADLHRRSPVMPQRRDRISLQFVIVSSCVVLVRVLVLVLVPRNRIFVIVLDPFAARERPTCS